MRFAEDGIKKLRAVNVNSAKPLPILLRGMRNTKFSGDFKWEGGTVLAFMSTTPETQ
jgi:hypothetical protein